MVFIITNIHDFIVKDGILKVTLLICVCRSVQEPFLEKNVYLCRKFIVCVVVCGIYI